MVMCYVVYMGGVLCCVHGGVHGGELCCVYGDVLCCVHGWCAML
jgi:hypothetical protein